MSLTTFDSKRHWFVGSIVLMVCAIVVLVSCTWTSLKLRQHQGQVTGLALTLTRIATLATDGAASDNPEAVFQSDQLAQLVAQGDIQATSIASAVNSFPINRISKEYSQLVGHWQGVRGEFIQLNLQSHRTEGTSSGAGDLVLVRQSFDRLFESIINESLSRPLIKVASSLRGDLASLTYVTSNVGMNDQALALATDLQNRVAELQEIVTPDNGPALLGYTASQHLADFLGAVDNLQLAVPAAAMSGARPSSGLSAASASALVYVQNALGYVDSEVHRSRRNVLIALSLACLGILLTTAIAWSYRRAGNAVQNSTRLTLDTLVKDISRIANGDLSNRSELESINKANQPIAELVDYTSQMVQGLVSVSRGVAAKTTDLASAQQHAVDGLAESNADQTDQCTKQLADLNAALVTLQQQLAHIESQAKADSDSQGFDGVRDTLQTSVISASSTLAALSAQLEVGVGRVERSLSLFGKLNSVISKMEHTTRQSNLQALNESIKQSSYYDTEDNADVFVQNTQRVSHQLQNECAAALQQASQVQSDLEGCVTALRDCLSSVDETAQYSLQAANTVKDWCLPSQPSAVDTTELANTVAKLVAIGQSISNVQNSIASDENLLLIKGNSLELQLIAAKLDESMLRFELSDSAVDER